MAGAGYKLFNTGDVLLASEVNTYLMQQTVMVFANATARTSALSGVLAEGMLSYLADTNATEVYDGSSWVSVSGTGDITAVTAGTGLSGGGTTGAVTLTNDMATTITAAGDIVVGTGSGTYDNLPIGTTGQVLTADTTVSPYKVKWAAAAGGGKVLQVVTATTTTQTSTTSTSFVDVTNLTASITPTANTSKVLVIVNLGAYVERTGDNGHTTYKLLRGSTDIYQIERFGYFENSKTANWILETPLTFVYLDSPNTTSSTSYKMQLASDFSVTTSRVNNSNKTSTITLLEVGA